MATIFASQAGSNTAPYSTVETGATSLATAFAAATSSGDLVVIDVNNVPTVDKELTIDTTYNIYPDVTIVSANCTGGSAWTYQPMGRTTWIGHSTSNRAITFAPATSARGNWNILGVTFRVSGPSNESVVIVNDLLMFVYLKDFEFWSTNTGLSSFLNIGVTGASDATNFLIENSKFCFGASSQRIRSNTSIKFFNCEVTSDSVPLTVLFEQASNYSGGAGGIEMYGCDFANLNNAIYRPASVAYGVPVLLSNCKLPDGVVLMDRTNISSYNADIYGQVTAINCTAGANPLLFAHSNALGDLITETSIKQAEEAVISDTVDVSWKITTTATCSGLAPYISPWFSKFNENLSAVTPYVEILENTSITPLMNSEVHLRALVRDIDNSPIVSLKTTKPNIGASGINIPTGDGVGSWANASGTAWSGRLQLPSVTIQEPGDISFSIAVTKPSTTIYVTPAIKGV
jgi:hypothetical protein